MSALNQQLPQDLIEAILILLPVKSLGRFKWVSKRWYSLISSPSFIKTHVHNFTKNNPNLNPTQLILLPKYTADYIFSLDIEPLNTQPTPATVTLKPLSFNEFLLKVLGSCNGLLLVYLDIDLCLLKPTTGKTLKIPDPVGNHLNAYGFGYDPSTDDYKIVTISRVNVPDLDSESVHVYSLRKKAWKMLPNFPCQQFAYDRRPGLLLDNSLHWLVKGRHSEITIAAFNLADEEFHEFELPDSFMGTRIFALGGKLAAMVYGFSPFCEFWVMEEYGVRQSWTKRYSFEYNFHLNYVFFAQLSNRDYLLGHNKEGEIVMYNIDESRCTRVRVEGCPEGFEAIYSTYVETLESLERFG